MENDVRSPFSVVGREGGYWSTGTLVRRVRTSGARTDRQTDEQTDGSEGWMRYGCGVDHPWSPPALPRESRDGRGEAGVAPTLGTGCAPLRRQRYVGGTSEVRRRYVGGTSEVCQRYVRSSAWFRRRCCVAGRLGAPSCRRSLGTSRARSAPPGARGAHAVHACTGARGWCEPYYSTCAG